MNIDRILLEFNTAEADYILIGGVNFLLRHGPELTFDIDFWVENSRANLDRVNTALRAIGAEWGRTEESWKPVPENSTWLDQQAVFCLSSRWGAVDIFREVRGLEGRYAECRSMAIRSITSSGVPYVGLSDQHMLETQLALEDKDQKPKRIDVLKKAIAQ